MPHLESGSKSQLLALARDADRRQQCEEALRYAARAVRRFPDSDRTREAHVRILIHCRDAAGALAQASEYLEERADSELELLRGDALAAQGRFDDAREAWRVGSDDRLSWVRLQGLNVGREQARRYHVAEAKRQFRRTAVLDPEQVEAITMVASLLTDQGDSEAAVAWAERAVEVLPKASAQRTVLARALLAAGRRPEAIEQAQRAVYLNPGDWRAARLFAQLRSELAQHPR